MDGSGSILTKEIRNVWKSLLEGSVSDEEIEEYLSMADNDGDGQIDYEEFVIMMGFQKKQKNNKKHIK